MGLIQQQRSASSLDVLHGLVHPVVVAVGHAFGDIKLPHLPGRTKDAYVAADERIKLSDLAHAGSIAHGRPGAGAGAVAVRRRGRRDGRVAGGKEEVMTQLCSYCGSTYDLMGGHSCTPTMVATGTATAPTPMAAPNFAASLSDDDLDRIAEAVVRKIREQARRQGRPVAI